MVKAFNLKHWHFLNANIIDIFSSAPLIQIVLVIPNPIDVMEDNAYVELQEVHVQRRPVNPFAQRIIILTLLQQKRIQMPNVT